MKKKVPLLSIVAIIHIIYNVVYYLKHGKQGDHEGWGMLATMVLAGAGVLGILIDLLLLKFVKRIPVFYLTEVILIIFLLLFFYSGY